MNKLLLHKRLTSYSLSCEHCKIIIKLNEITMNKICYTLLKSPKVIICDNSTSAVDMATEASIREGLAKKLPGLTQIIIAQRIVSVQDCDTIYVLDDGKIVGKGTHQELLDTNTIYQEVYNSQMREDSNAQTNNKSSSFRGPKGPPGIGVKDPKPKNIKN